MKNADKFGRKSVLSGKGRLLAGIGSLVCSAAPALALAATPEVAALEEIVVTAQLRKQNLQDVPLSVTAFSANALKDSGVIRLQDLVDFIPNLNYNTNGSIRATQITIRGIVSDANNIGVDQTVGVYVDGVYMARPTTINTGLYDLESVEVLRGPQGTLYGKNVIAGAIKFETRRPTEEFGGELAINYGNYDNVVLYGALNVPLVDDRLYLRVSAQSENRDGYLENRAGPDNNDADNENVRLGLLFNPNEDLSLLLRADWAKDRTHQGGTELAVVSPVYAGAPFNVVPGSPFYIDNDPFDYVISDSPSAFQDRDLWGTSLEVSWAVAGGELTSITAYREFEWNNYQSSDFSPFDIFGTGIDEDQKQYSQELRFSASLGERMEYVVGAYYLYQDLEAAATTYVGNNILSLPAFGGLPLGVFPGPSIGKLLPEVSNDSFAGFGQLQYELSDRLTLVGGLRYTYEKKSIDYSVDPDNLIVFPISPSVKSASMNENVVSPMASITYRLTENVNSYITYSEGFKVGGFNAFDSDFANEDGSTPAFEPEYADNIELGLKSSLLDDRVRFNAAAFYTDYKDLQVVQRLEDENGLFFYRTSNAAKAEIYGVEFELSARLTEGLQVNLMYGYSDAEYKDFVVDALTGVDYSGNSMVLAPEQNASLAAQYEYPLAGGWGLLGRLEYSYMSSTYSDQSNTRELRNDSYSLVNGRLGFENKDMGLRITAWVNNALEEEYTKDKRYGSGTFAPGALDYNVGNPRTYGLEVSYSF